MGLSSEDLRPEGIPLADAYLAIRRWYIANVSKIATREGDYARRSEALIHALPAAVPSLLEIRAVLGEVVYGNLEWAYHETDGSYKMAAYAFAALEAAGYDYSLTASEREQLLASPLARHFIWNRQ